MMLCIWRIVVAVLVVGVVCVVAIWIIMCWDRGLSEDWMFYKVLGYAWVAVCLFEVYGGRSSVVFKVYGNSVG